MTSSDLCNDITEFNALWCAEQHERKRVKEKEGFL